MTQGLGKKYRVCVSFKGKRDTRVVDNLTLARQKESTLKADLERGEMDIREKKPAPTLAEVWAKYFGDDSGATFKVVRRV